MAPRAKTSKRAVKRRGAAVVDRVLGVALEALAQQGFHRLSVPEVAARAGVNKTSVYRRWPTKGALVAAALERALGDKAALPETGSLRGDLVAFTSHAVAWAASPGGGGVMRALLADSGAPELRPLAAAMMKRGSSGPRRLLRRARARGEIAAGADVSMALTVVAGTLLQRMFIENAPATRGFIERLVDFVIAGLGASSRPAERERA